MMQYVELQQGDLIRWVSDWQVYAVDNLGDVRGERPRYSYGVVLNCYPDLQIVLIFCHDSHTRSIINLKTIDCKLVSRNKQKS